MLRAAPPVHVFSSSLTWPSKEASVQRVCALPFCSSVLATSSQQQNTRRFGHGRNIVTG